MGISEKQAHAIVRERKIMHREIVTRYGAGTVTLTIFRLCDNCGEHPCFLLPITTNGDDCPYYKSVSKVEDIECQSKHVGVSSRL